MGNAEPQTPPRAATRQEIREEIENTKAMYARYRQFYSGRGAVWPLIDQAYRELGIEEKEGEHGGQG
jgi:hypothetical protein